MKKWISDLIWVIKITVGCALFALGFDLFLVPNGLNAGGLSGLAMVFVHVTKLGTVGVVTAAFNVPLFILGGTKIGKKFFFGSAIGMVASSLFLDLFTLIPPPQTEPLLSALYGGILAGAGLGVVFVVGASTGGSDIAVRLLKLRYRNVPIGTISLCIDVAVATLTAIVFRDITKMLYTGVTLFVTSKIIDAVVYSFDYSKVAIIVTTKYTEVADAIEDKLERGVTYLYGQGYYSEKDTKVILSAIKKQQLAELKEIVTEIDPSAFIILQEAHQVLGDGFARYSKDQL